MEYIATIFVCSFLVVYVILPNVFFLQQVQMRFVTYKVSGNNLIYSDWSTPSELTVSEVVGDRSLATHAGSVPDFLKGDLVLPPKSQDDPKGSAHETFQLGSIQFIESPGLAAME